MKKETNKGFTLVELLVSVFIFSVIIGGMVNSLLTSIKLQQKIIADQKMFAEVSFVLEYMGRTLRMAQKDVDGVCTGLSNYNYNLFDGDRTIRFINYDGECQEFSLTDGAISERIADTESSVDLPDFFPITSKNVLVKELLFSNAGSSWQSPASNQSKIGIGMTVETKSGESEIRFQTTVSQRKLNFPY